MLVNLIHSWLQNLQRSAERSHTEYSPYRTFKSSFSLSLVSLNLFPSFTVPQNRAKHKRASGSKKGFQVLFRSPEELLNAITVVICDSMVKNEENVFVNCWHNKINFPSLNFFSSLLWVLMQCYWLALLKCQLAFLILNFSLNVISNCYCQTRECNLVLPKENPFLIFLLCFLLLVKDGCLTPHVFCFQEDGNALMYLKVKHSCFIYSHIAYLDLYRCPITYLGEVLKHIF